MKAIALRVIDNAINHLVARMYFTGHNEGDQAALWVLLDARVAVCSLS